MGEGKLVKILPHEEGQGDNALVKCWIIFSMLPYVVAPGMVMAFIGSAGSGSLTTLFYAQMARFVAVFFWTIIMMPFVWRGGQKEVKDQDGAVIKKGSAVQFGHKKEVRYIVMGVFMIVMGILMYASPILPLLYIGESKASEFLGGRTNGVGYTIDMNTVFIAVTGMCSYGIGFGFAIMIYGVSLYMGCLKKK
ncbi:hypothetical protein BX667DRAFT_503501 [Coemansia mojavensis]|nr:hypothetical protein BX667DRAFT_503501 [Coemansia mojavensis]